MMIKLVEALRRRSHRLKVQRPEYLADCGASHRRACTWNAPHPTIGYARSRQLVRAGQMRTSLIAMLILATAVVGWLYQRKRQRTAAVQAENPPHAVPAVPSSSLPLPDASSLGLPDSSAALPSGTPTFEQIAAPEQSAVPEKSATMQGEVASEPVVSPRPNTSLPPEAPTPMDGTHLDEATVAESSLGSGETTPSDRTTVSELAPPPKAETDSPSTNAIPPENGSLFDSSEGAAVPEQGIPQELKKPPSEVEAASAPDEGPPPLPAGPSPKLRYRLRRGDLHCYEVSIASTVGPPESREFEHSLVVGPTLSQAPVAWDGVSSSPNGRPKYVGTAFAVGPQGHLVTCADAVGEGTHFEVSGPRATYPAELIAVDNSKNVAVLQAKTALQIPLSLADSNQVELTQPMDIFGYHPQSEDPQRLRRRRTEVSGVFMQGGHRALQVVGGQHSGHGCPLIDESHAVFGLVCSPTPDAKGMVCTTSNDIKDVLRAAAVPFREFEPMESAPQPVPTSRSVYLLRLVSESDARRQWKHIQPLRDDDHGDGANHPGSSGAWLNERGRRRDEGGHVRFFVQHQWPTVLFPPIDRVDQDKLRSNAVRFSIGAADDLVPGWLMPEHLPWYNRRFGREFAGQTSGAFRTRRSNAVESEIVGNSSMKIKSEDGASVTVTEKSAAVFDHRLGLFREMTLGRKVVLTVDQIQIAANFEIRVRRLGKREFVARQLAAQKSSRRQQKPESDSAGADESDTLPDMSTEVEQAISQVNAHKARGPQARLGIRTIGGMPYNESLQPKVGAFLARLLVSPDAAVVEEALGALRKWGRRSEVPAVVRALRLEGHANGAVDVLCRIGDERALKPLVETILTGTDVPTDLDQMSVFGNALDKQLAAWLKRGGPHQSRAIQLAKAAGGKRCGQVLEGVLPRLEASLKDDAMQAIVNARRRANGLGADASIPEPAVPIASQVHPDGELFWDALTAGDLFAAQEFLDRHREWTVPEDDHAAIVKIVLPFLSYANEQRPSAIRLLGRFGREQYLDLVLPFATDEDESNRRAAIRSLGEVHTQKAARHLLAFLDDDRLQVLAARGLKRPGLEIENDMISMLADEQLRLRGHAAEVLGAIGGAPSIEPLRELINREPSTIALDAALRALAAIQDRQRTP